MRILKYPEDATTLRTPSRAVAVHEMKEAYALGKKMLSMLNGTTEIGLSAIQVGVPMNIIVIKLDNWEKILINSKIMLSSRERVNVVETCLSFNIETDIYRNKRPSMVKVQHRTLNGNIELETLSGLPALVLQHEMDHVKGKLMIDVGTKINLEQAPESTEA